MVHGGKIGESRVQRVLPGFQLRIVLVIRRCDRRDHRLKILTRIRHAFDLGTVQTVDQKLHRTVIQSDALQHLGNHTDGVEVVFDGLVRAGLFLRQNKDRVSHFCGIKRCQRHGATGKHGRNCTRKDHHVAKRQDRQNRLFNFLFHRLFSFYQYQIVNTWGRSK